MNVRLEVAACTIPGKEPTKPTRSNPVLRGKVPTYSARTKHSFDHSPRCPPIRRADPNKNRFGFDEHISVFFRDDPSNGRGRRCDATARCRGRIAR